MKPGNPKPTPPEGYRLLKMKECPQLRDLRTLPSVNVEWITIVSREELVGQPQGRLSCIYARRIEPVAAKPELPTDLAAIAEKCAEEISELNNHGDRFVELGLQILATNIILDHFAPIQAELDHTHEMAQEAKDQLFLCKEMLKEAEAELARLNSACEKEFASVELLSNENQKLKAELAVYRLANMSKCSEEGKK